MSYRETRILELIKQNPIFQNSSEESLISLISSVESINQYKRYDIILSQKNKKRQIGFILSGCAVVKKGRVTMSELNKGEIFGAVTLFSSEEFPPTTVYAKVESEVIFIDKENFEEFLWSDRKIAESFLRYLSDRIRFLTKRIDSLTAGDCETKLLSYLSGRQINGEVTITSFADLARRLDVGRASIYRVLEQLERNGKIKRDGKTIKLLN